MIEVLGRATSSNVQTVMWALAELGLESSRKDIGHSFGGNDTAEFLAKNPMGLVPVFIDDDVTLFESGAILRYLAAKHGDADFWPDDPAKRAELDMWAEWAKTSFYPTLIGRVFKPLVRENPATVDQKAIQASVKEIGRLAAMLDTRIGQGPWLAGQTLCFADMMCGHLLYRYYSLPIERPELPNLAAYYGRLVARPAYAEHVMVSYEPLRWTGS